MSLSQALQALTTAFVNSLIDEVRQTPIGELVGIDADAAPPARTTRQQMQNAGFERTYAPPAKAAAAPKTKSGKAERLKRRTPEQIAEAVTAIVALLKKHPNGMRSEQIRLELGLDVREVPRVIKHALDTKQIKVLSGQKRATTYGVGGKAGGKAIVKTPKKAASRKAAPKAKKAPKVKRAAPARKAKAPKSKAPKVKAAKAKRSKAKAPKVKGTSKRSRGKMKSPARPAPPAPLPAAAE
jgi:hypothetical protein